MDESNDNLKISLIYSEIGRNLSNTPIQIVPANFGNIPG